MTTRRAYFLIPGDINLPTGGYGYDREVLAHASAAELELQHVPLPGGYPFPSQDTLNQTAAIIAALPRDAPLLIDGLALGAMPESLTSRIVQPLVELCHHPLTLEPGTSAETADKLRKTEQAALLKCRHVIVTAPKTAEIVTEMFGIPPARITVAEPGTRRAPRATGSGLPALRIIAVGSIIPRKGYDVLVTALSGLIRHDWTLEIAGSDTLDPAETTRIKAMINQHNLGQRVKLLGALGQDELDRLYAGADLFVMPSHFEGYGMVIGEAMVRGLPIVATTGGALGETLPDGAGIKVAPGDAIALRAAIEDMLVDRETRIGFGDQAWHAGQNLPLWRDTAEKIRTALEAL